LSGLRWLELVMLRPLITIACLIIIFAAIKVSASLVVPFLLSVFLTILLSPAFFRLRQSGLPSTIALVVMVISLAVLCVLAITVLGASLDQFIQNLPTYQEGLNRQLIRLTEWLAGLGFDDPASFIAQYLNPQIAMTYAGAVARALSGILGQIVLIVIISAFMLVEAGNFDRKIRAIAGDADERVEELKRNIQAVRRYVSLKTAMSLLTGVLVSLWLWLLGIENALFMGLLAFFLNYVPNIGSFVAAIPGVLLGLISLGPGMATVTAVGYVAINVGVSNVIEPRFIGNDLGISPVIVLLSLVFWGWLIGPVGMLLSVPLTMVVKGILESTESTRPIAILLGPPPKS
jgi:predicted PurR-regulated permease PerM